MRRIVQIVTFGNGISRIVVSEIEAGDRAGTQLYAFPAHKRRHSEQPCDPAATETAVTEYRNTLIVRTRYPVNAAVSLIAE